MSLLLLDWRSACDEPTDACHLLAHWMHIIARAECAASHSDFSARRRWLPRVIQPPVGSHQLQDLGRVRKVAGLRSSDGSARPIGHRGAVCVTQLPFLRRLKSSRAGRTSGSHQLDRINEESRQVDSERGRGGAAACQLTLNVQRGGGDARKISRIRPGRLEDTSYVWTTPRRPARPPGQPMTRPVAKATHIVTHVAPAAPRSGSYVRLIA